LATKTDNTGSLLHLTVFAEALKTKFSTLITGEPEDQIRVPFEAFVQSIGHTLGLDVVPIGETLLGDRGGKPDYGIGATNYFVAMWNSKRLARVLIQRASLA